MKREILIIILMLFAIPIISASCVVPYDSMNINSDTTLCKGNYHLTKGINVGSIYLNVLEGITLDCNGSTLIGSGEEVGLGYPWYYSGVYVWNSKNITIKNCNITNFSYGITLWYVFNSTIINSVSDKNGAFGSFLYLSDSNRILNSKFLETKYDAGIEIHNSSYNIFMNNEFTNNSNNGIEIFSSSHNMINGNIFNYNRYGVNLYDEGYNNITNNTFYSSNANPPIGSNYWFDNIYYVAGINDLNSNNNIIIRNKFYGLGFFGFPDYNNTNNIYCINCEGNYYFQGALGPTCPISCNCEDSDKDDICDDKDICPNTPLGEDVDQGGCSLMQFCKKQPICGFGCDYADWKDNELLGNPRDCITVVVDIGGDLVPKCAALFGGVCGN